MAYTKVREQAMAEAEAVREVAARRLVQNAVQATARARSHHLRE